MSELICQSCVIRNCECVPYDVECDSCRRAYQQAIDEFMENIKNKYRCFDPDGKKWHCDDSCNLCDCGAVRVSDIEGIAEQLKGKKNG